MAKNDNIFDIELYKKSYENAIEKTARRIGREIEKAYEAEIKRFYDDYDPISYERTYSTWWASDGYRNYPSWNKYLGNLQYEAGIVVDPMNIQNKKGHPYRATTMWVFDRTWRLGIHGINKRNIRYKIKTKGRGKKKREYEVKWNYRRFPTNTRPAPKTEFIKAFNKIKQHKNIDRIFSEYWNEEISKLSSNQS